MFLNYTLFQLHIFSFKWKQVYSLEVEDSERLKLFWSIFFFLHLIKSLHSQPAHLRLYKQVTAKG